MKGDFKSYPRQGKLYTGKEDLAFTLFKCAAGGMGVLLQDKLKYL